jgi:mRNA-degrading endonuclease RelE of RelBE toxin-antitoxin system
MAYEVEWSQSAKNHLRRLSADHRRMVEDAVRRHLTNDAGRDAGARQAYAAQ